MTDLRDDCYYPAMRAAAWSAASILRRRFADRSGLKVCEKSRFDIVTDADVDADAVLCDGLRKALPEAGFLTEEQGALGDEGAEFRWVVDPLDGTKNFLHGIPLYAVSLALEQKQSDGTRETIRGMIYAPETDICYFAAKDKGAYAISGQGVRQLLMTPPEYSFHRLAAACGNGASFSPPFRGLRSRGFSFRDFGCTTLSFVYVAEGKLDALISPDTKPWDIAAGALLAKEAGAVVTDVFGRWPVPEGGAVAAGERAVHREILESAAFSLAALEREAMMRAPCETD